MAQHQSTIQLQSPAMNRGIMTIVKHVTPTTTAGAAVNANKTNNSFERVDSVMASDLPLTIPIHPTTPYPVREVSLSEWKEAAASLSLSFAEDATSTYFTHTPDRNTCTPSQHYTLHTQIMQYITYAHLLKGLVLTCGPNHDCVALWMPPGKNMDDLLTIFRSGMWRLNYLLSREGKKRFFSEFLPLLHDSKASVLGERDEESWYLVYIGTKPSGRGNGYAKRVMEGVLDVADREGRACYLESSHAVNRTIYGKMGFEVTREIYLQRASKPIQLDIMVREPRRERE